MHSHSSVTLHMPYPKRSLSSSCVLSIRPTIWWTSLSCWVTPFRGFSWNDRMFYLRWIPGRHDRLQHTCKITRFVWLQLVQYLKRLTWTVLKRSPSVIVIFTGDLHSEIFHSPSHCGLSLPAFGIESQTGSLFACWSTLVIVKLLVCSCFNQISLNKSL